jgi:PAS domain S-box-containing protein
MPGMKKGSLNRFLIHFGVAICTVLGGFLLRLIITDYFGPGLPTYITFYPSVMLAAIVGGFLAGLVATTTSILITVYWILPPIGKFAIENPIDAVSVVLFSAMGAVMSGMAELYRRNRQKAAAYDKEMALQESEERWAITVASIGDAIITTDVAGKITFMNRIAEELTGWELREVSAKAVGEVFNIINESTRRKVDSPVAKVLASGNVVGLANHTSLVRKDGTEVPVGDSGAPIKTVDGKTLGVVLVFRDISERKRAEEALRGAKQEAERRAAEAEEGKRIFDVLMTHVPTGITIANAKDLRVEVMSLYGQVLTGFPDNRMVGVPLDARAAYWLHPENGTPAKPEEMPLFRAIRQGEVVIDEEWVLQRPSGERFTILCNAAPIRDSNGNINAGVLAWTDITTQRMAQEKIKMQTEELRRNRDELADRTVHLERLNRELVALNADLDDFTHMASHDLQEPLRSLIAFSDLLPKDLGQLLPDRAAQDLGFITDATKRMQTLIRDLLALSRAGRAAKKREKVSLSECAGQALEALAMRVKEMGAKISRDELPEVWGDSTLLTQLYQNLIGNALKFSGDQSPIIQLTFEERKGDQIFGVKDNGIGIDLKYAQQIFEPFRRLHSRADYEGSGIGLAICRKIVERHGGKIWVDSEPGKGAHFRFTISRRMRER